MRISDWSSDVCSSDLSIYGNVNRQCLQRLPAQSVAHSLRALQHGSVFYREQVMSKDRGCVLVLDLDAILRRRQRDRKSVVKGKSVSVGVGLGGRRNIKKKPTNTTTRTCKITKQ